MARLQKTIRGNGSILFSLNIPLEIIEQIEWEKGQELEIVKNFNRLIIFKKEDEDTPKIKEEKQNGSD